LLKKKKKKKRISAKEIAKSTPICPLCDVLVWSTPESSTPVPYGIQKTPLPYAINSKDNRFEQNKSKKKESSSLSFFSMSG
jgi:hypothetical protein